MMSAIESPNLVRGDLVSREGAGNMDIAVESVKPMDGRRSEQ